MTWNDQYWSEGLKNAKWAQNTLREIDFILNVLSGQDIVDVLDVGCGFGRHAFELSKRGYSVVGVEINREIVGSIYGENKSNSGPKILAMNAMNIDSLGEFDLVLNLYDGAIGYFSDDYANELFWKRIFDAVKPGGFHVASLWRAEYFSSRCPFKDWHFESGTLTISSFDWSSSRKTISHGGAQISGNDFSTLSDRIQSSVEYRLYALCELDVIYKAEEMEILGIYHDFTIEAAGVSEGSPNLIVFSRKKTA